MSQVSLLIYTDLIIYFLFNLALYKYSYFLCVKRQIE